mgnify:CR=1 FL=1
MRQDRLAYFQNAAEVLDAHCCALVVDSDLKHKALSSKHTRVMHQVNP